ncbi:MAG: hypothetical protein AAB965_03085, partial [Patescibacteria group bacterium]
TPTTPRGGSSARSSAPRAGRRRPRSSSHLVVGIAGGDGRSYKVTSRSNRLNVVTTGHQVARCGTPLTPSSYE